MRRSTVFLAFLCSSTLSLCHPSVIPSQAFASQDVILLPDPSRDKEYEYNYYEDSDDGFDDYPDEDSDDNSDEDSDDGSDDVSSENSDEYYYETDPCSYDSYSYIEETESEQMKIAASDAESASPFSSHTKYAGTDAVLVIDVSGSMKQSDPDCVCRKAAMEFIEEISQEDHSRVALVTFCDTLQDIIPLTLIDKSHLENEVVEKLNQLTYTNGDTDIGTAMQEASRILIEESDDTRAKSILLLTDGEIDLPQAKDEEAAEKESLTRALVAVEDAKSEGIVIHTVSLDLSGHIDVNLMNYMADSTGGTSSHVRSPIELEDVFSRLSLCAKQQAKKLQESEEMTQAMIETESETETETEKDKTPVVRTTGTIDGPIFLKGLLPGMCLAELNLSHLFYLTEKDAAGTDAGAGATGLTDEYDSVNKEDGIIYTAYADDNTLLDCRVEHGILSLKGLKNGISSVHIYAEPSAGNPDNNPQASVTFTVSVDALIPSVIYLIVFPCIIVSVVLVFLFLHRSKARQIPLSGMLQWYVRGENEKIFGMPGQLCADLSEYGSKVCLSELIQDELISDASLNKVVIRGIDRGIIVVSKTGDCMIQSVGSDVSRKAVFTNSSRFKILCETERGRAAVIAFYQAQQDMRMDSSYDEDYEERTRMLG